MLTYYSDRYPKLSGLLIVLIMTVVPGLFVIGANSLLGGDFPVTHILIAFAFVIQIILCFKVEQMFLTMLPFVAMLIGVLVCEGLYLISQVRVTGAVRTVMTGQTLLSLGVSVFAPEFVGIVVALIAYAVISIVRSFID